LFQNNQYHPRKSTQSSFFVAERGVNSIGISKSRVAMTLKTKYLRRSNVSAPLWVVLILGQSSSSGEKKHVVKAAYFAYQFKKMHQFSARMPDAVSSVNA